MLQRAHLLSPENGEITYHLATVISETGDSEEARRMLRALVSSNKRFSVSRSGDGVTQLYVSLEGIVKMVSTCQNMK